MKFPLDVPVKIVQLGAGGTGAHAAPHLYRLLYSLDRPVRYVLCDGDKVEPKNLIRQNFAPMDLEENKAKVISERYSTVFGMETEYVSSFVEDLDTLMELITPNTWAEKHYRWNHVSEMVILLGCVDNNKSRQLCHQAFMKSKDLIYIDSGNEEITGQIVCGVRRNHHTMSKPVGSAYPGVLKTEDKFPSEMSCAEAAQADPQSMAANITAATAMVDMVYNILAHGECVTRQTIFSTRTVQMQTVVSKSQRRKAS